MKQPNEMTDDELNEAMAIEIMGWHIFGYEWHEANGRYVCDMKDWHPTTYSNQAIECAEKYIQDSEGAQRIEFDMGMNEDGVIYYEVDIVDIDKWMKGEKYPYISKTENDSLARAICEAVLQAKRGEK